MATHELGPGSGSVLIKTGRAGLAARAGHDLTLEITRWSGAADDDSVTAEFDLGSLIVRGGTGGAKPLTDRDRRDIESTARKILGGSPGEPPTARFASTSIIASAAGQTASGGAPSGGVIEGTLTMHGQSRPIRLQVVSPAPGRYRGSATVRQTDFGITPYSGFLGALKLRDDVEVEFHIDIDT